MRFDECPGGFFYLSTASTARFVGSQIDEYNREPRSKKLHADSRFRLIRCGGDTVNFLSTTLKLVPRRSARGFQCSIIGTAYQMSLDIQSSDTVTKVVNVWNTSGREDLSLPSRSLPLGVSSYFSTLHCARLYFSPLLFVVLTATFTRVDNNWLPRHVFLFSPRSMKGGKEDVVFPESMIRMTERNNVYYSTNY